MERIGTKLVNDKREAILASNGVDEIGKKLLVGRDLLTVLSESEGTSKLNSSVSS